MRTTTLLFPTILVSSLNVLEYVLCTKNWVRGSVLTAFVRDRKCVCWVKPRIKVTDCQFRAIYDIPTACCFTCIGQTSQCVQIMNERKTLHDVRNESTQSPLFQHSSIFINSAPCSRYCCKVSLGQQMTAGERCLYGFELMLFIFMYSVKKVILISLVPSPTCNVLSGGTSGQFETVFVGFILGG